MSLRILICVKPVRDSASGHWRMNHYDGFAVEEAVRIREHVPGSRAEAVMVGPEAAAGVLRRAMGMGVDDALHIREPGSTLEPFQIASLIAAAVRTRNHDLVLAGVVSEDAAHGQLGALMAEMLDRPCATAVVRLVLEMRLSRVTVDRELEGGARERLELPLPAVLTIQSGINTPRYPALSRLLQANRRALPTIEALDLGIPPSRVALVKRCTPPGTRHGLVLEGRTEDKARELYAILRRKGLAPRPAGVRP